MAFENSTKFKYIVKMAVEKHGLDPDVAQAVVSEYYRVLYDNVMGLKKPVMRMEYFGVLILSKQKLIKAIDKARAKVADLPEGTVRTNRQTLNFEKLRIKEKALIQINEYYERIQKEYLERLEKQKSNSGGN